jgi:hypothetical protein
MVAYLKARIYIAIWYQPMNWLANLILPLWGIVRTSGDRGGDICTSGQRRIYVGTFTYIHQGGDVYT